MATTMHHGAESPLPAQHSANADIPQSIVKLNRWLLVVGILGGLALQQPLFTTLLFAILLPAPATSRRAPQ